MRKYLRWALIGLVVLLVIAQFFQISKTNPEFDAAGDFIAITAPSDEVKGLLKDACYDCHSYETKYPWYTYFVPLSYWINNHIKHGREHLNFSIWASYDAGKADHKLEECAEEVEEGKMPLKSYTITHGNAKLSDEDRKLLEDFFNGLRKG
jgi:hypothetical protein